MHQNISIFQYFSGPPQGLSITVIFQDFLGLKIRRGTNEWRFETYKHSALKISLYGGPVTHKKAGLLSLIVSLPVFTEIFRIPIFRQNFPDVKTDGHPAR